MKFPIKHYYTTQKHDINVRWRDVKVFMKKKSKFISTKRIMFSNRSEAPCVHTYITHVSVYCHRLNTYLYHCSEDNSFSC